MFSRTLLLFLLCIPGGATGLGCGGSVGDAAREGAGGSGAMAADTGGSPALGGAPPSGTGGGAPATTGGTGLAGQGGATLSSGGTAGSALPDPCGLPFEPGDCDAVIPVYWHDPETGLCTPRDYGGCGGNSNRFGSLPECQTACRGALPASQDLDLCSTPPDCALTPRSCCGGCDPATSFDLVALRADALERFRAHIGCSGVMCEACPPVPPADRSRRYLYAACESGQCTLRDLRSEPLTRCTQAADCRLRCGAACCSSCDPEHVVALRQDADELQELCGSADVGCDDCVCELSESVTAECAGGRCVVVGEPICTPGMDATCNADLLSSWLAGTCNEDGTCTCAEGRAQDSRTGLCN